MHTWKSPRFDADAYKKLTDVNWMAEYKLIYLKQLKLVTNAARPSLINDQSYAYVNSGVLALTLWLLGHKWCQRRDLWMGQLLRLRPRIGRCQHQQPLRPRNHWHHLHKTHSNNRCLVTFLQVHVSHLETFGQTLVHTPASARRKYNLQTYGRSLPFARQLQEQSQPSTERHRQVLPKNNCAYWWYRMVRRDHLPWVGVVADNVLGEVCKTTVNTHSESLVVEGVYGIIYAFPSYTCTRILPIALNNH